MDSIERLAGAHAVADTAQRDQAVLQYQETVRQAFRDVSDALVGYRKLREYQLPVDELVLDEPGNRSVQ